MARRTQLYKKIPWTGGLNDAVDPGILNDNDLVIADNVVFTTSGSRLKREGVEYLDTTVPVPTHKESSGTTRTLYFQDLQTTTPTDKVLVVGEAIAVTGDTDYATSSAVIQTLINTSGTEWAITYEASTSVTESKTATTNILVEKSDDILDLLDYWYLDNAFVKQQLLLHMNENGKLFKYDLNGNRDVITGDVESFEVNVDQSGLTTTGAGDYWTFQTISFSGDTTDYYVWYNDTNGSNTDPAIGNATAVQIDWDSSSDTDTDIATATAAAIDALADVTATSASEVVTVTLTNAGDVVAAEDENTGFTAVQLTEGATAAFNSSIVNSIVMNNRAVFAFDTVGYKPIKYYPEDSSLYQLLGGSPPDFSLMVEHQGRMWTNDKTTPDRVHYCSPGNIEEWNGTGDSGAIDVGTGDGDPEGITALFTFKGILFVAKRYKLYRIDGTTPETYTVTLISDGIGCVSQKSVAKVDQDDVLFISYKGVHSITATDAYGDVTSQYKSVKIQNTFNEFNLAQIKKAKAVYIDNINSVAFSFVARGSSIANDIYLYNTNLDEWYKWPNLNCTELSSRIGNNNKNKLLTGTSNGRVIQAQRGTFTDFEDSATDFRIKSGTIYPGNDITSIKGFKRLSLLFKPKGNFVFTVKVKIDNYKQQVLTFQQESIGDELGTNFVLGQSVLGVDNSFAPFTQPINGYGRGISIEIVQSGKEEQVEIYGFILEYEDAGLQQEVIQG